MPWWVCKVCRYPWLDSVGHRTNKKNPRCCPACAGKVATDKNRLVNKKTFGQLFDETIERLFYCGKEVITLTLFGRVILNKLWL